MEIRQLRYFLAVAEELNFTRAAGRVHISQPPLSRQIALLEGELNAKLFTRSKHGVQLTNAGRTLLTQAYSILGAVRSATDSVGRAARGEVGQLSIGFTGSTMYSCVPTILRAFRDRYPEVRISLTQRPLVQIVDDLKGRQIDIGFTRGPFSSSELRTDVLLRERLVVALPSGHTLEARAAIQLKALAAEDFIVLSRSEGTSPFHHLLRLCESAGFSPNIVEEPTSLTALLGLVASKGGIAILPESTACVQLPDIVYRRLAVHRASTDFILLSRKVGPTPDLERFLAVAKERAKALARRGNATSVFG